MCNLNLMTLWTFPSHVLIFNVPGFREKIGFRFQAFSFKKKMQNTKFYYKTIGELKYVSTSDHCFILYIRGLVIFA
jgi:hypothetical protein